MEKRLNDKKETFSKKIIANEYVRGAASFTAPPLFQKLVTYVDAHGDSSFCNFSCRFC
jgi:hypothetical protein